jgi:hypothetical protein
VAAAPLLEVASLAARYSIRQAIFGAIEQVVEKHLLQ